MNRIAQSMFALLTSMTLVSCSDKATSTTALDSSSSTSNTSVNSNGTLTDARDGQTYKTVVIGKQTWMAQNLAYLPSVDSSLDNSLSVAKYYVYGYNGSSVTAAKATPNYQTYGALYNYAAAQTACPAGWHLPDSTAWATMANTVDTHEYLQGTKLTAAADWPSNSIAHTNTVGFRALPGGYLDYGDFGAIGSVGDWWTATDSYSLEIDATASYLSPNFATDDAGYSVRCVKDSV